MLASKFIETELNAYIQDQRLIPQENLVRLIAKAFEAYDQYRRLVSIPRNKTWEEKQRQVEYNVAYSCPDLDQTFDDFKYK